VIWGQVLAIRGGGWLVIRVGTDLKSVPAMKRYLEEYIRKDLQRKIILLTGPRQTGKTTLAKMLSHNFDYFNYDNAEHRLGLMEKSWDRSRELVIFDELHKLKNWKSWLKGIYDTEKIPPPLLSWEAPSSMSIKKLEIPWREGFLSSDSIPSI
jgi:predicted AAA+ superfamily ATPase